MAGILIETASFGDVRYAVIGVGINLQAPDVQNLRTPPAGLVEVWPEATAAGVLQRVMFPLVQSVQAFAAQGFGPLRHAFHVRDLLYGQAVVCSDGLTGQAGGVDSAGALLVHTAAGLRKITSAEVSVRPVPTPLDHLP
jgi:BirA family biotin operon repressor/biotin-[acetyl-CoA-carboxylase] ligase